LSAGRPKSYPRLDERTSRGLGDLRVRALTVFVPPNAAEIIRNMRGQRTTPDAMLKAIRPRQRNNALVRRKEGGQWPSYQGQLREVACRAPTSTAGSAIRLLTENPRTTIVKRGRQSFEKLCLPRIEQCSPDRIRTGVTALRGRRPRPLDDGAEMVAEGSASPANNTIPSLGLQSQNEPWPLAGATGNIRTRRPSRRRPPPGPRSLPRPTRREGPSCLPSRPGCPDRPRSRHGARPRWRGRSRDAPGAQ
jgi:hypothetical protein